MQLNINMDAVVKFTNTLEKLHKSALPVAIRESLNEAAKDVKQNTMPKKAASTFVNRTKDGQFFKANSKFNYARGWDVNNMVASVGFFENKLVNQSTNYAVKDLEGQEETGMLNMKTFIPTVFARNGGTKKGLVKPNFRLNKIREKGIVETNKMLGGNDRQKYMFAAYKAGKGGFVIYKKILWQINRIEDSGNSKKVFRTPIYTVSKGRNIRVKSTHFMKLASLETNKKMEGYYIGQAKKQINRLVGR